MLLIELVLLFKTDIQFSIQFSIRTFSILLTLICFLLHRVGKKNACCLDSYLTSKLHVLPQPNREEKYPLKLFWHTVTYIPRHSTNQSDHVSPTLNLLTWFHLKTKKLFVGSVVFQIMCQDYLSQCCMSKKPFFTLISPIPNKKIWKLFRSILNLPATDVGRNKGKAFQLESEPITDLQKK